MIPTLPLCLQDEGSVPKYGHVPKVIKHCRSWASWAHPCAPSPFAQELLPRDVTLHRRTGEGGSGDHVSYECSLRRDHQSPRNRKHTPQKKESIYMLWGAPGEDGGRMEGGRPEQVINTLG